MPDFDFVFVSNICQIKSQTPIFLIAKICMIIFWSEVCFWAVAASKNSQICKGKILIGLSTFIWQYFNLVSNENLCSLIQRLFVPIMSCLHESLHPRLHRNGLPIALPVPEVLKNMSSKSCVKELKWSRKYSPKLHDYKLQSQQTCKGEYADFQRYWLVYSFTQVIM